jgi:hypothetical protein
MMRLGFLVYGEVTAPEQEEKICDEISAIRDALERILRCDDMYEFALNFNLAASQKVLSTYLQTEPFKKFESDWKKNPGILYKNFADDPAKFLPGKICIQIGKDKNNLPVSMRMSYKAKSNAIGRSSKFTINFADPCFNSILKNIREHDITYLKKDVRKDIEENVDNIFKELKSASNKLRLKIISEFNDKWKDKLELKVTLCLNPKRISLEIKDRFDAYSIHQSSSQYRIDRSHELAIEAGTTLPEIDLEPSTYLVIVKQAPQPVIVKELSAPEKKGYLRQNLFPIAAVCVTAAALVVGSQLINISEPMGARP